MPHTETAPLRMHRRRYDTTIHRSFITRWTITPDVPKHECASVGACAQRYRTLRMANVTSPFGRRTVTSSPKLFPNSARATGESMLM